MDIDGLNQMIPVLSGLNVTDISEIPYTLEDHFMKFYREEEKVTEEQKEDMEIQGGVS